MRRKKKGDKTETPKPREQLEAEFGRVLDTRELAQEFVLTGIVGDVVIVRRKADSVVGTMRYQNRPRFFFGFTPQPAG